MGRGFGGGMKLKYLAVALLLYLLLKDSIIFFIFRKMDGKERELALGRSLEDHDSKSTERIPGLNIFFKYFVLNKWFNRAVYLIFISIVIYYFMLDHDFLNLNKS